jgi:Mrp family chromosome partitioning ATPase
MRDDYYSATDDPFGDFAGEEQPKTGFAQSLPVRLMRGRWHWAVILGVLLAGGGVYLGYNFQKPEFTAFSEITIKPNYGVALELQDISLNDPYWNMVGEEMDRLQDPETAELAMARDEWQNAVTLSDPSFAQMSPMKFAESIELFAPQKNDFTMEVNFISEDPLIAQAGMNALLEAYRELAIEVQDDVMNSNLKLLNDRKRDLELLERQIREQMRLVIPDSEYIMIKRRLAAKLGELANMEFRAGEIELIIEPFMDPERQASKPMLKELMKKDPEMVALLDEKKRLEDDYEFQTVDLGRGETMASVVQTKRQLDRVNREILDLETRWMSEGAQAGIKIPEQIQDLMATYDILNKKISEIQAETNDLASRIAAVEEFEFKLTQTRDSMRSIDDQISELSYTSDVRRKNENVTRIEIGDPASLPMAPSNKKKRIQLAGVGGVAGMGLGFGLVMLVGLMDRRLRHVSDTETTLPGTNMLGILPTLPADLKDPEQAETAAHCVHHIRTLLQIGGTKRVFSITSPTAGSGKSSLATALGMSFAATGSSTLVIDSDLVGAGISRRMGSVVHESLEAVIRRKAMLGEAEIARAQTIATAQNESLEDVLINENLLSPDELETAKRLQLDTSLGLLDACAPGRLRSCVASTGMDNFFVLPVGKARPSDATRLSPSAMRELIRQAREAFDIVLIDTGPVLGSLEASIAAAESDSTVMIVSRGDNKSIATKSINQLRSVHADIAGLVFNHAMESDFAQGSYASLVSQERRPDLSVRKRKLDKTRSARLGPLGTAVASCSDDDNNANDEMLVASNGNGKSDRHE